MGIGGGDRWRGFYRPLTYGCHVLSSKKDITWHGYRLHNLDTYVIAHVATLARDLNENVFQCINEIDCNIIVNSHFHGFRVGLGSVVSDTKVWG